jgi:hypothetical protein
MKLHRATSLKLALLLALLLPLQGFAAVSSCAQTGLAHAATHSHQASPAAEGRCDHASPNTLHHDCGTCCCVAVSSNSGASWLAPLLNRPQPALVRLKTPLSATIDRLDRPPRFRFT